MSDVAPRTVGKLRRRILPILFVLYIVAYLDRINISFAALTMNSALGITSAQFGLLAGIFFLGYFFFEVPSNLLLHKVGARVWITRILVSWGIVAMLTGLVRNMRQLYFLRFLLGVAEAGYFPGMVLYLTYWFPQREQARAIAWFMTGLPIASVVGAPISGFILDNAYWLSVDSWRWLLILEGIPAIGCGIMAYFMLSNRPSDAKFLLEDEKDWITGELSREERQKLGAHGPSALQALANRRVWHLASIAFSFQIGLYTMSFFMPQAVKSLSTHYSETVVGVLVMVPSLIGLAVMMLVSRDSDRTLERRYHAAIPAAVSGLALMSTSGATSPLIAIALWSLVAAGNYGVLGPFWSLPGEFLTGVSAASGIALINSVGSLGGFIGPFVIGAVTDRTGTTYAGLSFAGISSLASATLILLLRRQPLVASAATGMVVEPEGS